MSDSREQKESVISSTTSTSDEEGAVFRANTAEEQRVEQMVAQNAQDSSATDTSEDRATRDSADMAAITRDVGSFGLDGTTDRKTEEDVSTPTDGETGENSDTDDNSTALNDLEELRRRVDAGETVSGGEDDGGTTNASTVDTPATTSSSTPASSDKDTFAGRGRFALRWTPQEDAEVIRLCQRKDITRRQRADMFNAAFPGNPPRSVQAIWARFRKLVMPRGG